MKLQINQKGSWRNVVQFSDDNATVDAVIDAVVPLARALGKAATWRIAEEDGQTVVARLDEKKLEWVKP